MQHVTEAKAEIDSLTRTFFSVFSPNESGVVDLSIIHRLFIPQGIVIKNCGTPEIYTLEQFIAPREVLLNKGELVDFKERELRERTEIFGNIAQRFCLYEKSGVLSGTPFKTRGMKTLQFIKTEEGWRMSALAWDDERDGLTIPETFFQEMSEPNP